MRKLPRVITASFVSLVAFATGAPAQETRAWEVTGGAATVICPLTVGGSFEARTSALSGRVTADPAARGKLEGGIEVDLTTLDTGIDFRDRHMKEKYLEVQRGEGFDRAVISEIRLDGVDPVTGTGKARFNGSFTVHGTSRRVLGEAEIRAEGSGIRIDAAFPLSMSDYGIAKTEYLGVGVKNEIRIKVVLNARPLPAATTARASAD